LAGQVLGVPRHCCRMGEPWGVPSTLPATPCPAQGFAASLREQLPDHLPP
jgi:hypothetical protein